MQHTSLDLGGIETIAIEFAIIMAVGFIFKAIMRGGF